MTKKIYAIVVKKMLKQIQRIYVPRHFLLVFE